MKSHFSYLINAIPPDIYHKAKATICEYVAIFEPEGYAVGKVLQVDDYHFVLFLSGAPVTRVNQVDYAVEKGDMLVIQPWDEVYGVPDEVRKHGKYLHIAVKKDFFQQIAAEVAGGEPFQFKRIHGRYSHRLLDLIGNFQLELMNYGQSYPQMIQSISTQLVFQLIRDLCDEPLKNGAKAGRDNPYISKAIQLMQEYYQTSINIGDICNLIYLSPGHFKRVFKEYTGQTPHQYLMQIRIEKAKELLKLKEHSIEDTARLCGFINSGHFAVAFKRSTKMSPSEYRKRFE